MASYRDLYGLKVNPFPLQGSFPLNTTEEKLFAYCYTTNEKTKNAIESLIDRIKRGASVPVVLVVGDYGYGKTHLLRYLFYRIKDEVPNAMPIYVKSIEKPSALTLYTSIVQALEQAATRSLIFKAAGNVLKKTREYEIIHSVFPDFAKIIHHLAQEDINALRWLHAKQLPLDALDRLGVLDSIKEDNAIQALKVLTKMIFYGLNIRLVILIDELEEAIVGYENSEIAAFYKVLRDIIDSTMAEAYYILAVTPIVLAGAQSIKSLSPALTSRLSGEGIITLTRLTKDVFFRLVEKYLINFREQQVRSLYESLYPFTADALELVYEKTLGVPRNALQLLGKILDLALKHRKKNIDRGFVLDVLEGKVIEKEEEQSEVQNIIEEAITAVEEEEHLARGEIGVLLKKRIKNALSKSRSKSMALYELSKQIRSTYELTLKYAYELESEGLLIVKKRGRGYRIYWRGP